MGKVNTGITLDPEIMKRVDEERGDVPRSTYINDLLYWAIIATPDEFENRTNGV